MFIEVEIVTAIKYLKWDKCLGRKNIPNELFILVDIKNSMTAKEKITSNWSEIIKIATKFYTDRYISQLPNSQQMSNPINSTKKVFIFPDVEIVTDIKDLNYKSEASKTYQMNSLSWVV